MSPETNGNPPPITKRKKNRDKINSNIKKINDLNPPLYNNFLNNISLHSNSMDSTYQSFLNYSVPTEPMSLPVYPSAYQNFHHLSMNPNLNIGGNMQCSNPMNMPFSMLRMNMDSNEYMSLPIGNFDQNENTDKRRYSDPGLPNESDSSSNSLEGLVINKLTQQMNTLKESNHVLIREMTDLRMEMNMLKQQQARGLEREYEPGMLADIIREVRDAARVREDALLARVKHMIEEKNLSMNQLHLATEKNRNNERLAKLEEQLKNLSVVHNRSEGSLSLPSSINAEEGSGSARQVLELEREALQLRRELQEARARKEESDQKLLQLDKKLASLLRRKDTSSDVSEDSKASGDTSFSVSTPSTGLLQTPHRITLSGPVTDL